MNVKATLLSCLALGAGGMVRAEDPPRDKPLPIPLTRPEMKQALEDLKGRTPRFVLPEPTEAEKAAAGERGLSYESRLRTLYLGGSDARGAAGGGGRAAGGGRGAGGGSRTEDPNQTLPYAFKTQLFWIVSRTNNCLY
jgi:hypothetical protein